jgi:hypothetical protein
MAKKKGIDPLFGLLKWKHVEDDSIKAPDRADPFEKIPPLDYSYRPGEFFEKEFEARPLSTAKKGLSGMIEEEAFRDQQLKLAVQILQDCYPLASAIGSIPSKAGVALEHRVARMLHLLDGVKEDAYASVCFPSTLPEKVDYCQKWTKEDTAALQKAARTRGVWSPSHAIKGVTLDKVWIDEAESILKPHSERAPEVELEDLVEHEQMIRDPAYGAF